MQAMFQQLTGATCQQPPRGRVGRLRKQHFLLLGRFSFSVKALLYRGLIAIFIKVDYSPNVASRPMRTPFFEKAVNIREPAIYFSGRTMSALNLRTGRCVTLSPFLAA